MTYVRAYILGFQKVILTQVATLKADVQELLLRNETPVGSEPSSAVQDPIIANLPLETTLAFENLEQWLESPENSSTLVIPSLTFQYSRSILIYNC